MKHVWNESPLRTNRASQKDHYEETEICADLHVERRINALWHVTESGKALFLRQAKMDGNDFINILFMQSIQQHMQDMVCNAGLIWDPCYERLSPYVPSLWYEVLADLQWTFTAISKQATVALLLSLKGHLGLLIAFQKASLLLNKIANGKEHNHVLLPSWSSP